MRCSVWQVLGATALILLFVLALWKIPKWQVAELGLTVRERIGLENDARTTLAQILGGAVLLVGLIFTWRTVRATERNIRMTQESTARNLEILQKGQITERFTRAVDQLGSDKLQIRLGGIYALERIAQDSEEHHWPIMEILTAYVRENAPWNEDQPAQQDQQMPEPTPDIQAILTVLGRRTRTYQKGEKERLNLIGVDIRSAKLAEAHLEGVNFYGANLQVANFREAHLENAYLRKARLRGALLCFGTHLDEVDFTDADVEEMLCRKDQLTNVIGLTETQIEQIEQHTQKWLEAALKAVKK